MDEKPRIKTVGRRTTCAAGLEAANGLLKLVIELRGNKPFIPKETARRIFPMASGERRRPAREMSGRDLLTTK